MKILSIDGGGIKGLFSAAFLAGLEERFKIKIGECFDLISGTSTGGILALALAARIPAQDIVEFYKKWGPKIFPQKFRFFYNLRGLAFSKYDNRILETALKEVFREKKVEELYKNNNPTALCIPSINAITGIPFVFKTPHNEKLVRDNEYYLWQVAMATSAAPTYFPIAKIKIPNSTANNLFVDGGLWANNPSVVALTEALTYGKAQMEGICLLSVGNIQSNTTFSSTTRLKKGVLMWRQNVINLTLETQSYAIHNQVRLLFEGFNLSSHYIRVEQEINSQAHKCLKKLDCATEANMNDLEVFGREKSN